MAESYRERPPRNVHCSWRIGHVSLILQLRRTASVRFRVSGRGAKHKIKILLHLLYTARHAGRDFTLQPFALFSRNDTKSKPEQHEQDSGGEQDEDDVEECKQLRKLENIFRTVLQYLLASFEHCLLTLFPCIPPSGRNERSGPENMR